MNFRLVALETWPNSEAQEIVLMAVAREGFSGEPFPQNAAKRVAELGGRGVVVLEAADGTRTAWRLHAAIVHYVYPVTVPA